MKNIAGNRPNFGNALLDCDGKNPRIWDIFTEWMVYYRVDFRAVVAQLLSLGVENAYEQHTSTIRRGLFYCLGGAGRRLVDSLSRAPRR